MPRKRRAGPAWKSHRNVLRAFYTLYQTRMAEFRADPPGADWDGVYVAKSKTG